MKIKKMLLKLYVSFLMLFFSLAASVFLFGTSSKAYVGPNNYEYDSYFEVQNTSNSWIYKIWVNSPKIGMSKQHKVGQLYQIYGLQNNQLKAFYYYYHSLTENSSDYSYGYCDIVGSGVSNFTMFGNPNESCPLFDTDDELLSYLTSPDIDFDNPFYSSNIVAPTMRVTYRELSSTPVVDVPLNIQVYSYPSTENEYYVQLFGLVNYDENYYVQNTRDGLVYNGMDLQRYTEFIDIVNADELLKPSDLSFDMLHLRFTDGWYDHFPSDSLFSFTFQEGIPSPLQTSAITKFNNFRKNATFADNTVYVYARYFVIDDDNNFVVGPWRIWKSYNPNEFTTEVPNYYLPYGIVPGTSGTNTSVTPVSTSSPEPSVIDSPVQTNPTVNVTVTQNVPNYPDYPTIASYNKDNLLVDTMDQLSSLEGFFGEFGSFLVTAFAFMPAWIWAIIGVGFSLSIVVMFIKIL